MKHQAVAVWEVFAVEPELAYDICLELLAVSSNSDDLVEQGAPQHFIREEDRPRRFVLETVDGPVTSRLEMDFAVDFAGTWVTQRFSLHPHGFLARLLTATPRRRLGRLQDPMRAQLRFLKLRCEEQGLLGGASSSQQRRLRIRGEELLTGFAYFEILLGDGMSSKLGRDLLLGLYENARLHFALTGPRPDDVELRRIVEEKIYPGFERRLETGEAESLSFFIDAFPYYMAWAKRLFAIGKDGIMALDAIARGDREVMGKLVLESFGPPETEELARMRENMEQRPENLFYLFARWLQERQGAPASPGGIEES